MSRRSVHRTKDMRWFVALDFVKSGSASPEACRVSPYYRTAATAYFDACFEVEDR